jgi:hypothetical protein
LKPGQAGPEGQKTEKELLEEAEEIDLAIK